MDLLQTLGKGSLGLLKTSGSPYPGIWMGASLVGIGVEVGGRFIEHAIYGFFHDYWVVYGESVRKLDWNPKDSTLLEKIGKIFSNFRESITDIARLDFYVLSAIYLAGKIVKNIGKFIQCAAFSAAVGTAFGLLIGNPFYGGIAAVNCLLVSFTTQIVFEIVPRGYFSNKQLQIIHDVSSLIVKVANLVMNAICAGIVGFAAGSVPGALTSMTVVVVGQVIFEIINVVLYCLMNTRKDVNIFGND